MLIDTHCHIHESQFFETDREDVYRRAIGAGVKMLCIGTSEQHSREAIEFTERHAGTWAVVGVHPHDVKDGYGYIEQILKDKSEEVVGVGEIGLDYFYTNSPKDIQKKALEQQLQWALEHDKPVSFHVRDAFDDFWPIFHNFPGLKGVLHSFTDSAANLEKALGEGLYIGVNGISTFTKDESQRAMFDAIPLTHMLLETDAPFLTPAPHRGKVNEPAFVRHVAEYHAKRRAVELEHLARVTSANAKTLFSL
jgi:TatD DNase family protein